MPGLTRWGIRWRSCRLLVALSWGLLDLLVDLLVDLLGKVERRFVLVSMRGPPNR